MIEFVSENPILTLLVVVGVPFIIWFFKKVLGRLLEFRLDLYREAVKKHNDELLKGSKMFLQLLKYFTENYCKILWVERGYISISWEPKHIFSEIGREALMFLSHYSHIYDKLARIVKSAEKHNADVDKILSEIEIFVKNSVAQYQNYAKNLLISGVASAIQFSLFEHPYFIRELVEEGEFHISSDVLHVGGFGIAKIQGLNNDVLRDILNIVISIEAQAFEKYGTIISELKRKANNITGSINKLKEEIEEIIREHRITGKFKGKCKWCPRLFRYLLSFS